MKIEALFLLAACLNVMNPGAAVLMTVTNALREGLAPSCSGIVGVAAGAMLVATGVGTGLALLPTTMPTLWLALQLAGAALLLGLGWRLWHAPAAAGKGGRCAAAAPSRFVEGVLLQCGNPATLLFFVAVLPQTIDSAGPRGVQLAVHALAYGAVVLAVHAVYALAAHHARGWLAAPVLQRWVHRLGAAAFAALGIAVLMRLA